MRPMQDRQAKLHWPQLKIWSGFDCIVLCFFLLPFLSLRVAQQMFSKEETTWLVVRYQVSQFSARMDHGISLFLVEHYTIKIHIIVTIYFLTLKCWKSLTKNRNMSQSRNEYIPYIHIYIDTILVWVIDRLKIYFCKNVLIENSYLKNMTKNYLISNKIQEI